MSLTNRIPYVLDHKYEVSLSNNIFQRDALFHSEPDRYQIMLACISAIVEFTLTNPIKDKETEKRIAHKRRTRILFA